MTVYALSKAGQREAARYLRTFQSDGTQEIR